MSTSTEEITGSESAVAANLNEQLATTFDHKGVVRQLTQLSSCSYMPELIDMWTPERAFALYVIAQALSDIDPLDPQIPLNILGSPKRLTDFFDKQEENRKRRVVILQETEERLRCEGIAIVREYRIKPRMEFESRAHIRARKFTKWKSEMHGRKLRREYQSRLDKHKASRDEIDCNNFAVRWFEEDREAVALWCDLADIDLSRCYRAVERRLLRLDRCSIKIHKIVISLTRKTKHEKEIRTAKNEDRQWNPFGIQDAAKRRRDKALDLMQLLPRDAQDIASMSDKHLVENMRQTLTSASNIIGQRQLERLQRIVDKIQECDK